MYGSMYGGSVTDSRIIKPTPSPAVQRAAEETWCSEALLDPAHGRNAQSTRADTADECTATPPHVVRHILPPPTESDLKRSVKEDVAGVNIYLYTFAQSCMRVLKC